MARSCDERWFWAIAYVGVILMILLLLSGCAVQGFAGIGGGYAGEAGWSEFDETGAVGHAEVGIEFVDERWYTPTECGWYHRSMLDRRPEIATNDYMCKKRHRFGEKP